MDNRQTHEAGLRRGGFHHAVPVLPVHGNQRPVQGKKELSGWIRQSKQEILHPGCGRSDDATEDYSMRQMIGYSIAFLGMLALVGSFGLYGLHVITGMQCIGIAGIAAVITAVSMAEAEPDD